MATNILEGAERVENRLDLADGKVAHALLLLPPKNGTDRTAQAHMARVNRQQKVHRAVGHTLTVFVMPNSGNATLTQTALCGARVAALMERIRSPIVRGACGRVLLFAACGKK